MDKIAKAIMGGVVSGLAALSTALLDGVITPNEWVVIASAVVTAVAFVWGVPNAQPNIANKTADISPKG